MNTDEMTQAIGESTRPTSYRPLYWLMAVCAAPVFAAVVAYFWWQPAGRVNYGDLIEPQRPAPALQLQQLDGHPARLSDLRGKWLMLTVDAASCDSDCRHRLWKMRQVRLTQGKDSDRIERVWLVTDRAPLEIMLMREHEGAHLLRADPHQLEQFLALPDDAGIQPTALSDHIWLVDPLGNLMLRWPKDADPSKMKRDLSKLLKASRIG